MEGGEGMVAFVQSLKDAGLAVTLLDSGNKYTLLTSKEANRMEKKRQSTETAMEEPDYFNLRDNNTQVTDGHYASTYRVCHCNVKPSSPPMELPEFPPQRPEVFPGQSNFEVGGLGSGEFYPNYSPMRTSTKVPQNSFERGPSSARPSHESSVFANSLRKYPNVSPDRSTETVERILNYTSNRNSAAFSRQSKPQYQYHQRLTQFQVPNHQRRYHDESPTRDQPVKTTTGHDRCRNDFACFMDTRGVSPLRSASPYRLMVDRGVQAAASRVNREVTTTPIQRPVTRNVAISQSPTASEFLHPSFLDQPSLPKEPNQATNVANEDIQRVNDPQPTIHAAVSNINLAEAPINVDIVKSYSEVLLRKNVKEFKADLKDWLNEVNSFTDLSTKTLADEVLKKLKKLTHKHLGKKVRFKICNYLNNNREAIRERYYNEIMDVKENPNNKFGLTLNRDNIEPGQFNENNKVHNTDEKCYQIFDTRNQVLTLMHSLSSIVINGQDKCYENKSDSGLEKLNYNTPIETSYKQCNLIDDTLMNRSNIDFNNDDILEQEIEKSDCLLKDFISNKTKELLNKFNINLKPAIIETLHNNLFDVITNYGDKIKHETNGHVEKEIVDILHESGLSKNLSMIFTKNLLGNVKEYFKSHIIERKINTQSYIIYNTSKSNDDTNISISGITPDDINTNLDAYITEVAKKIDEWLMSLKIPAPEDKGLRDEVINELASDIVDRQKYLQLNLSGPISEDEELEHLKCQIFKWINKLVGKDRIETIENALDLMKKIQRLPVPMLRKPDHDIRNKSKTNNNAYNSFVDQEQLATSSTMISKPGPMDTSLGEAIHYKTSDDKLRQADPSGAQPSSNQLFDIKKPNASSNKIVNEKSYNPLQNLQKSLDLNYTLSRLAPGKIIKPSFNKTKPSVQELNQQFYEYLLYWVQEIPIPVASYEDQVLAEKVRLGIRNGIFKAVAKINLHSGSANNSFYYQDLLDEEVESLLSCLPQIPELAARKPVLKAKLLEKTKEIYDQLKDYDSYTRNLVKQIKRLIPRKVVKVPDAQEYIQDYLILYIVENYMLCKSYEEFDSVKAEIYRKKLAKYASQLFDELKQSKCLQNEQMTYEDMNNIIKSLDNVTIPSDETIKNEVDEILLGLEIENWCTDLPMKFNDERVEQLQRRRLRDALTKKLLRIENDQNLGEESAERELKQEVSRFLAMVPLEDDEDLNINFMVNELTNRLKNRQRGQNTVVGRKSVSFQRPVAYEEFGQSLPQCCHSSFSESLQPQASTSTHRGATISHFNPLIPGNMVRDTMVRDPRGYKTFDEHRPLSSTFQQNNELNFDPFRYESYNNHAPSNIPQMRQNFDNQYPSHFNTYIPRESPEDFGMRGQMYIPESQNQSATRYNQSQAIRMSETGRKFGQGYTPLQINQGLARSMNGNFSMPPESLAGNVGSTLHEPSSYLNQYGWTTMPSQNPNLASQSGYINSCCQPSTAQTSDNRTGNHFIDKTLHNTNVGNLQNGANDATAPGIPAHKYLQVPPRTDPDLASLMTSIGRHSTNQENASYVNPSKLFGPSQSPKSANVVGTDHNYRSNGSTRATAFTIPMIPVKTSTPKTDNEVQTAEVADEIDSASPTSVSTQASIPETLPTKSKATETANGSTPVPPTLRRRKMRHQQFPKPDLEPVARRLDYSDDEEEITEFTGKCRCFERFRYRRRTPSCFRNHDSDIEPFPYCLPMRYPFPYYY